MSRRSMPQQIPWGLTRGWGSASPTTGCAAGIRMSIVIVGSEGCLASGFIGLVDILSLAQRAIADSDRGNLPFRILTASIDGLPVRDGRGRLFDVDMALQAISACDAIIVPGFVPTRADVHPRCAGSGRPPLGSGIIMHTGPSSVAHAVVFFCSAKRDCLMVAAAPPRGGCMMK
jgi:hypothetical protein